MHLFFYCSVTKKLQDEFLHRYLLGIAKNLLNCSDKKTLWFEFRYKNDLNFNLLLSVVICLFQNTIWEFKLNKKAPSFITFCNELLLKMEAVISSSPLLKRLKKENINNITNLSLLFQNMAEYYQIGASCFVKVS